MSKASTEAEERMWSPSGILWPGEVSARYVDHLDGMRSALEFLRTHTYVVVVDSMAPVVIGNRVDVLEPDPVPEIVFKAVKFVGAAPYVGRPFAYTWRGMIDHDGLGAAESRVEVVPLGWPTGTPTWYDSVWKRVQERRPMRD